MKRILFAILTLMCLCSVASADLVDRIRYPGHNGLPANEFTEVFRFWAYGTFNDARALQATNYLCDCELNPTERGQASTIRVYVLAAPTQIEKRLADFRGGMMLLQTGVITETEFRTFYGLPRQ